MQRILFTLFFFSCFSVVFFSQEEPVIIEHDGSLYVYPEDNVRHVRWFHSDYIETNATDEAKGAENTRKIVQVQGEGWYAAYYCDTLQAFGYNDWYLPSKEELQAIYNNKEVIGNITCEQSPDALTSYAKNRTAFFYWSSTETCQHTSFAMNSCDGLIRRYAKKYRRFFVVRCVRRD